VRVAPTYAQHTEAAFQEVGRKRKFVPVSDCIFDDVERNPDKLAAHLIDEDVFVLAYPKQIETSQSI
jgi:hypothetical protein